MVFLCDPDVVVSPSDIELWEECLISQVFESFSDVGKWIIVLDCPLINLMIVHNDTFFLRVFLVDKVDWRCIRRWSFFNPSSLSSLARNFSRRPHSFLVKGYTLQLITSGASTFRGIVISSSCFGGKRSDFFLENTFACRWYLAGTICSVSCTLFFAASWAQSWAILDTCIWLLLLLSDLSSQSPSSGDQRYPRIDTCSTVFGCVDFSVRLLVAS